MSLAAGNRGAFALALPEGTVRPAVVDAALGAWRETQSPSYKARAEAYARAETERADLLAMQPRTMVMQERAMPVDTFVTAPAVVVPSGFVTVHVGPVPTSARVPAAL